MYVCGWVAIYTAQFTGPLLCPCNTDPLCRCDADLSGHHFFVGGIDIFSHTHNNLSESFDFIGNIKNLVIDSVRVDMASPVREVNTLRGVVFTSEPKCGEMEVECSGPHYAGCLDYDLDSHCICSGGFKSDTCNKEKSKCVCVTVCVCVFTINTRLSSPRQV